MSYDPGTYISLEYLNKQPERKTSASAAGKFLCDIGTHFKLVLKDGQYTTARRIEVSMA